VATYPVLDDRDADDIGGAVADALDAAERP
jgi:hypothetical protein